VRICILRHNCSKSGAEAKPGVSRATYAGRVSPADQNTSAVVLGETLFHFTHTKNLASIVQSGKLLSDTAAQTAGCISVEVGDRDVKSRRRELAVDVGPGGCPADYFPFYFAPRSPMLYVISKGQVPEYQEGQDPLVYLATDVATVIATGRPWVYSDGNCASVLTEYSTDLGDMATLVDWEVMKAHMWANTLDDGDRMRRRMAEFLVHEHLPWSCIKEIGVRNEQVSQRVRSLLARLDDQTPVRVRSGWYY
jgi:hypothetical protein